MKTKTWTTSELVVVGVEGGDRAPVALLAWEREDNLVYAGGAMVTLGAAERDRFWDRVEELKSHRPPVETDKKLTQDSWTAPAIRLRVNHLRREEMLRHATVEAVASWGARPTRAETRTSRKPTYAKPGISMAHVQAYYRQIALLLLPWIAKRPLNLFRCENGRCFFQRNGSHPRTVATFEPPIAKILIAQKNRKTENYLSSTM